MDLSAAVFFSDPQQMWPPCLGRRLTGGVIEYLDLPEPDDDDFVALTLIFEPDELTRLFMVKQTEADWELACVSGLQLPRADLPKRPAADHPILAPALGQAHGHAVWYADNDHIKAVRLQFGSAAFALGCGHYSWDETSHAPRFDGFWSDDLVLWSGREFDQLLQAHRLTVEFELGDTA